MADPRPAARHRPGARWASLDSILGRRKPAQPTASTRSSRSRTPRSPSTLQTAAGFEPTGVGSVCYRRPRGRRSRDPGRHGRRCSTRRGPRRGASTDEFGFTWLVAPGPDDLWLAALVTDLHAVNTALEAQGYRPGAAVLAGGVHGPDRSGRARWCTSTSRARSTRSPPLDGQGARQLLEIQVRDLLNNDLPSSPSCSGGCRSGARSRPLTLPDGSEPPDRGSVASDWDHQSRAAVSPLRDCRAGRASARARPWPTARSRRRP